MIIKHDDDDTGKEKDELEKKIDHPLKQEELDENKITNGQLAEGTQKVPPGDDTADIATKHTTAYAKSQNFNTVFCNGVKGGFTGPDEFCFTLFREKIVPNDDAEGKTLSLTILREEQVEVIMTMAGAKVLADWLNKHLENKPTRKQLPLLRFPTVSNN